ncbi:MAG: mannose-1-phosphate guanylyltransferase [Planctomycetota bacterium]
MRYALIIAGGSGTRLWPMSTKALPKQLIPFIESGDGGSPRSLLQISMERLGGLVPAENIFVCAGESMRQVMLENLPGLTEDRFIGEPMGRDTLNAVALGCGVLGHKDPDAVVAIFTADHIIEPVDEMLKIVEQGYELAEAEEPTLVTFGIAPTHAATGYGYLELGETIGSDDKEAYVVNEFKEKPEQPIAEQYHAAGPTRYLWNSGMFVWKASIVMDCVKKYAPDNFEDLNRLCSTWGSDACKAELHDTFGGLKKVSVDYAIMEPASNDEAVRVAAVPMPLSWLDVGSWPSFGETREKDSDGNGSGGCKTVMMDSKNTLAVSDDPEELITTIGVEGLIIIRAGKNTLVCKAEDAERIKQLHAQVGEQYGNKYL